MLKFDLEFYNKEAEEPNGSYWKFLSATYDDLEKDNVYLYRIKNVLVEIKNEELKSKMLKKLHDIADKMGIFQTGIYQSIEVFKNDEIKIIAENELNNKLDLSKNNGVGRYFDFVFWLSLLERVNDKEWEYSLIRRYIDYFKNQKQELVSKIETCKRYKHIYNRLLNDYFDYLPEPYKNYLKMKKDPLYISKRSLEFMNIDIGIDPKISIGPEIEANNDYDIHIDVASQNGYEYYIRTSDPTVPNGDEVYPIRPFHNNSIDVSKFCALCEAMKDLGYYYNSETHNAAGQINLGLDYLDTKESILNFYEIYGNCEELLYYISSEEGQLFRQTLYTSSRIKPLSEIVGKRVLDEDLTRNDVIRLFNSRFYEDNKRVIKGLEYKKNSVCLRGVYDDDYRLEFRIPNGGCNYKTWIDNIRLYGKMLEVSKKIADAMKNDYLTLEEERLLNLKLDLQDNMALEDKLYILMDLLFDDDKIKQIYIDRFNSVVKILDETNDERYRRNYSDEPGFAEVEFDSKYKSRLDPNYMGDDVISYDPNSKRRRL